MFGQSRVYADNKQFNTIQELKREILDVWGKLEDSVLEKLYRSMLNRIYEVINRNGKCTHY